MKLPRFGRRWLSPRARVAALRIVVVLALGILGLRLWSLQVVQHDRYQVAAEDNRVREVTTPAPRGEIVDDMGRALVANRTSLVVSVDRSVLERLPDAGRGVFAKLGDLLHQPADQLSQKTRLCSKTVPQPCWNGSPYQPIPVATDVDPQTALEILEHPDDYPGVSADTEALPTYPQGTLAAHELGYVGPASQQYLASHPDTAPSSVVGQAGLESTYDADLRGKDGVRRLAVDRYGRVSGTVSDTPAQAGDTLVTALDSNVQRVLEGALGDVLGKAKSQGYPADTASGVVLNWHTGQVVAMGSLPSYDPSQFVDGISQQAYDQLTSPQAGTPLISRAYQGSGAPGSTFKAVSLSAAVMSGLASLDGVYGCPPTLQVGNQTFHNFDGESGGDITLHQAIVISCDVIFDKFAYDAWLADGGLRNGKGPYPPAKEVFVNMARAFGFGRPSGIDLPGETSGLVVDRAGAQRQWEQMKDTYCRRAQTGYPEISDPTKAVTLQRYAQEACQDGYLYNGGAATQFAIGQGQYLSVSPLQLAVAYAAVANGGTVWHPRVAKAVLNRDGQLVRQIPPSVAGHLPVSPQVLDYLRASLCDVTRSGTASGAFGGFPLSQVHVCGKTGTAEVEGQPDTSWFVSFDDNYVVVITVPKTGQGALFAAPAVREVWEGIYGVDGRPAALPNGQVPGGLPVVRPDGSVVAPQQ